MPNEQRDDSRGTEHLPQSELEATPGTREQHQAEIGQTVAKLVTSNSPADEQGSAEVPERDDKKSTDR